MARSLNFQSLKTNIRNFSEEVSSLYRIPEVITIDFFILLLYYIILYYIILYYIILYYIILYYIILYYIILYYVIL